MPVFTVILSRTILGETQSAEVSYHMFSIIMVYFLYLIGFQNLYVFGQNLFNF